MKQSSLAWAALGIFAALDCGGVVETTGENESGGAGATAGMTGAGATAGMRGGDTGAGMGRAGATAATSGGGGATASGGTSVGGVAGGGATASGGTSSLPVLCASQIVAGSACPMEGEVCFVDCRPAAIGRRTETCMGGVYVESECALGTCTAPTIPNPLLACDSVNPPQVGQPCPVPTCELCGPEYLDSRGNGKVGYCVCDGGDTGTGSWLCTSVGGFPP